MMARCCGLALGIAIALAHSPAVSAQDYFSRGEVDRPKRLVPGERTRKEKVLLYSMAGATLAAAGLATGFALHSRSKANDVSTTGTHTGLIYTQSREDTRDSSVQSRGIASATFAVSGALLVTTTVLFVATHPDPVEAQSAAASIAPTRGGALVTSAWSF